jgi:hypothetical protein
MVHASDLVIENGLADFPKVFEEESRLSFEYFIREGNWDIESAGYGLIQDRKSNKNVASIAAVGFCLAAMAIGAERNWIRNLDARFRVSRALDTLIKNVDNVEGFFYHFVDILSGKRAWKCEASIIDTALCLCGAITAGEYFGGEIKEKALIIYDRVNWEWYRDRESNKFHMGYSPERGFYNKWDAYAEQFMMYALGSASKTYPVPDDMTYAITREIDRFKGFPEYVKSPCNALFTHQFSHAFIDFRFLKDREGTDWWRNSVIASLSNRQYCINNTGKFETYGPDSWGLTACDSPSGYKSSFGASITAVNDGTLPPCGAAGSAPFTPRHTLSALEHMKSIEGLFSEYGFKDSYCIKSGQTWVDDDYIGIDKGISLLMIENLRDGIVWKTFMKNSIVQDGIKLAGFSEETDSVKAGYVLMDSKPAVGEPVRGLFCREKGCQVSLRWLISDSAEGNFSSIPGAVSMEYIPAGDDFGRYLMLEMTAKLDGMENRLYSQISMVEKPSAEEELGLAG